MLKETEQYQVANIQISLCLNKISASKQLAKYVSKAKHLMYNYISSKHKLSSLKNPPSPPHDILQHTTKTLFFEMLIIGNQSSK